MSADTRFMGGALQALPEDVEQTRTVDFIASTNARDRHSTRLNQDNWQLGNYTRNGIIGYQHNVYGDECNPPNPDDVIGRGQALVENGQLIIRVTFEPADLNPLAEKIFRKVQFGTLNAVSVGFSEVGQGKYGAGDERAGGPSETYYFEGQELLEVSIVNIPSNPEAVKRHLRDSTARAMMFIKRALPELTFSDIERLSVADVVRGLSKQRDVQPVEEVAPEAEVAAEEMLAPPEPTPPAGEPAPAEAPAASVSLEELRSVLRATATSVTSAPVG